MLILYSFIFTRVSLSSTILQEPEYIFVITHKQISETCLSIKNAERLVNFYITKEFTDNSESLQNIFKPLYAIKKAITGPEIFQNIINCLGFNFFVFVSENFTDLKNTKNKKTVFKRYLHAHYSILDKESSLTINDGTLTMQDFVNDCIANKNESLQAPLVFALKVIEKYYKEISTEMYEKYVVSVNSFLISLYVQGYLDTFHNSISYTKSKFFVCSYYEYYPFHIEPIIYTFKKIIDIVITKKITSYYIVFQSKILTPFFTNREGKYVINFDHFKFPEQNYIDKVCKLHLDFVDEKKLRLQVIIDNAEDISEFEQFVERQCNKNDIKLSADDKNKCVEVMMSQVKFIYDFLSKITTNKVIIRENDHKVYRRIVKEKKAFISAYNKKKAKTSKA